jgi:hypothetical protein
MGTYAALRVQCTETKNCSLIHGLHVHSRKQKLAALYMSMAGQAVQLLP